MHEGVFAGEEGRFRDAAVDVGALEGHDLRTARAARRIQHAHVRHGARSDVHDVQGLIVPLAIEIRDECFGAVAAGKHLVGLARSVDCDGASREEGELIVVRVLVLEGVGHGIPALAVAVNGRRAGRAVHPRATLAGDWALDVKIILALDAKGVRQAQLGVEARVGGAVDVADVADIRDAEYSELSPRMCRRVQIVGQSQQRHQHLQTHVDGQPYHTKSLCAVEQKPSPTLCAGRPEET